MSSQLYAQTTTSLLLGRLCSCLIFNGIKSLSPQLPFFANGILSSILSNVDPPTSSRTLSEFPMSFMDALPPVEICFAEKLKSSSLSWITNTLADSSQSAFLILFYWFTWINLFFLFFFFGGGPAANFMTWGRTAFKGVRPLMNSDLDGLVRVFSS